MAELYLSRLVLDPRSGLVRMALADVALLHRHVMSGFPDDVGVAPRAQHAVLWRLDSVDDRLDLLVQSSVRPDWSRVDQLLSATPEVRAAGEILSSLVPGTVLRFRLVANPTRKIDTKTGSDGIRRNGRRVPLRDEVALLEWLVRKAAASGFTVGADPVAAAASVVVNRLGDSHGRRREDQTGGRADLVFGGVQFDGRLTVTDPTTFCDAVATGFGPGKAFGYGLLTVARA